VKRIWMMVALLASVVGCGQLQIPKVILVTPLSQQDVLDAKAAALIAANTEVVTDAPQDDETKPVKCLCGGTGRSGDGLGPCACPDGCACKTRSAALEVEPVETEAPEPEATEPEPVEEETLDVAAKASPDLERIERLENGLLQLTDLSAELVASNKSLAEIDQKVVAETSELSDGLSSLEQRVTALEAAKQVVAKQAATDSSTPRRQLVLFYADKDLEAVEAWDVAQGTQLVDVGWSIGTDESFQIVKLRLEDEKAELFHQAAEVAAKTGTPYWAVCNRGAFERGAVGLPSAKQVAEMLNPKKTAVSTVAPSGGVEPWRSIPETWPARVPISGTTTPSKELLVWHLRGGGTGGGNHVNDYYQDWPLESMTTGQLVTLHDSDHPVPVQSVPYQQPIMQASPVRATSRAPRYSAPVFSMPVFGTSSRCQNGKCR
jgi:hypothetical protein